ncbi:2-hydroxyacid dehydrogenase [Sphingomonas quercus]|uniref:2-hydroxyacid dehydrogenase n=1 Tax=Sphingomonas quercus TaxID=2842451 RepID=A0ABS6BEZ0_9SPHN|nr:2-hydroxyacid dehydrogenase [Sphingomonas quercus]MBU3076868.1 2-hydroxyacid dehydrogenase [Sphingomonas quercus]
MTETPSAKPPVLMLMRNPSPWALDDLATRYTLLSEPAPGIEVVITGGTEGIDAATIDRLPDLKLIAVCAVGYDQTDVAHAHARGAEVTNTPDVLTDDVADLAIGLMIATARRIPAMDRYVRGGRWVRDGAAPLATRFSGRRIGILGLGRIGRAIAWRAVPFALEIAYHARSERRDVPWRYEADPVALAASVDVLVVATAGGAGTAGLVDRAVLDALGPDGMLINIARGSVVDEAALVAALAEGRLGSAGLDVFADEPNVPQALLAMENVVLMPHMGSATRQTRAAMAQLVIDNVDAFFAGRPLLTPVPRGN